MSYLTSWHNHYFSGMAAGCRSLEREALPTILDQLRIHNGFSLLIVGYSLGAGLAQLFTRYIVKKLVNNISNHCISGWLNGKRNFQKELWYADTFKHNFFWKLIFWFLIRIQPICVSGKSHLLWLPSSLSLSRLQLCWGRCSCSKFYILFKRLFFYSKTKKTFLFSFGSYSPT